MKRALILVVALGGACSDDTTAGTGGNGGAPSNGGAPGTGGAAVGGSGGEGGTAMPSAICDELDLPSRAWVDGPYGAHRGELAESFELALVDGTTWTLAEAFSGCESYVFVPDTLVVSDLDDTSIWESDLDQLIEDSPKNAHYFFVSRKSGDDAAASVTAMQGRIDELVATLPGEDADHWRAHLHAVQTPAGEIDGWVGDTLAGIGRIGFAIDRDQRIRGVGLLADVSRYNAALNAAGKWPWKSNLAYAAKEPSYFNAQELVRARHEEDGATVVTLWDGDVLEEFAETDVTLPSAEEMAGFDTMEIELEQACPNPDELEFGNCGAWDYIALLSVRDEADGNVELARFITSYHRETHWTVDVSGMLAHLKAGGDRHFRWDFAPSWNTQPTGTKLSLRFSNQGKAMAPTQAQFLWSGGVFDPTYNGLHLPIDAPIPATATRVELFTLVTGHGAEAHNCAEFCNHQHEVTVNGTVLMHEFPEAGTNDECIPQLEHGMVPNQGGTWWFGRGGWCPGEQVDPWIEDVTDLVTPGETATLSYRGLYAGADPTSASGNITLTSYLVVWE